MLSVGVCHAGSTEGMPRSWEIIEHIFNFFPKTPGRIE